ncbi:cytochrome c family protein [Maritimibacter sp. DP1N21-5]|uniref:c-type cytochrome n=1 Tax=Maritimibacter sp. DP1N21-5 TaxID=2836867 RepID=UPI001C469B77|nr:cytochrome C [Maritimibacter sp. DP1N21-5]MBV7410441.1 cytochrome C [Maritimibacter sp. DP1N21-5]
MKAILITTAAMFALAAPAFAQGDAAAGEDDFKKCKSCHAIVDDSGEAIVKGGKTGPNLYGVIGRHAAATDFNYGDGLVELGETGMIWTEELLVSYLADPSAFVKEQTGDDGAKSKMTFKLKDGADVAAYLATFSSDMPAEEGEEEPATN